MCKPITKVSFSDDKFVDADWEAVVLPGNVSVPGYIAMQVNQGGAPSEFRSMQAAVGASSRHFIHLLKGYVFDPAKDGGIVSIDGGYHLKSMNRTDSPATLALLLVQNGAYYRGPVDNIRTTAWTMFTHTALKATDFVNLSREGPRHPTFTCAGGPIQIGFCGLGR